MIDTKTSAHRHGSAFGFRLSAFALPLLMVAMLVSGTNAYALAFTATTSGSWNLGATWGHSGNNVQGNGYPGPADSADIPGGITVTVTANQQVGSVNFDNSSANTGTLTVNTGVTLAVTTSITLQDALSGNTSATIAGAGAVTCASVTVEDTTSPNVTETATTTLTSTIATLSISGNLTIGGNLGSRSTRINDGEFDVNSGSVNVGGGVVFNPDTGTTATLDLTTAPATGTLTIAGATPFTGTGTFTPNGSGATVVYSGAAQTVKQAIYNNLTLSGSGAKTTTGVTVNGNLTMAGTATASAVPTYGAGAGLVYQGSGAQTTGVEFPTTWNGSGGVTISNTAGTVSLGAAKTINALLTIINGAKLSLNAHSSTASALQLDVVQEDSGTWGGTGSGAGNINTTFFAGVAGILTVSQGPATQVVFTTQPVSTSEGATMANVVVKEEDDHGNVVTLDSSSTVTLSFANNPGGATLSGTTTVTLASGVATFSGLSINNSSLGYTLTASSAGLTSATSVGFNVTGLRFSVANGVWSSTGTWSRSSGTGSGAPVPTAADTVTIERGFTVTEDLATATAGSLFVGSTAANAVGILTFAAGTPSLTVIGAVQLGASSSNTRDGTVNFTSGSTLTAASLSIGGTTGTAGQGIVNMTAGGTLSLGGSITVNTGSGTFTAGAGTVQFTATASLPTSVFTTFNNLTISAGTTTLGVGLTINGNVEIDSGAVLNISTHNSTAVTLSFNNAAQPAGTYGASGVTFPSANFLSKTLTVSRGPASQIVFTSPSTPTVAGVAFATQPIVTIKDALGNVVATGPDSTATVTLTLSSGTGTLGGTISEVAVAGVANFTGDGLNINLTGNNKILTATATVTAGPKTATSSTLTIVPAAVSQFVMNPATIASATVGTSISPSFVSITAEDAFGNVCNTGANNFAGTVTFGGSSGVSGTSANFSAGVLSTFPALIPTVAGSGETVTATSGSVVGTTTITTVTPGVATKLAYTSVPATGMAGVGFSVTVTSEDAFGNPVSPTSATTITLSKATGGGILGGTTTGTILATGTSATISGVTYTGADTMTLTATPTAGETSLTPVTSGNIVFSAGPATHIVYTSVPSTGTAGTVFSVTVTSEDIFGNPSKPTANTTITLTRATGGGTLGGTTTGTILSTATGVTISGITYTKADTMTLTATATVGEVSLGFVTSGNIVFSPGAVSAGVSTVVAAPTSVAADGATTSTITVTLTDATGNPVSGKTVTVAKTTGPGTPSIVTVQGTTSASGVATFTVASTTTGIDTFTATDVTDSSLAITQKPTVTFVAGPATQLVYTTVPATGTAGTPFSVTVTSEDAFGNPSSPTSTTTITLSLASGGGTLSGTLTGNILSSGSSVTISTPIYSKADTMTLTATATAGETSLGVVTSGNIVFSPGAVSAGLSTVVASPTSVAADGATTSTITVTLTDGSGNPVSGKTVTVAKFSGPGTPTITTVQGTTIAGVATFTVKSTTAGADVFSATDSTDSITITTKPTVTFVAGPATKLAYTTVPAIGTAGVGFSVTVTSEDAFGNPVAPTSDTTITLSKAAGGGSLSGTTTGTLLASGNSVTISGVIYSGADTMTLTATATAGETSLTAVTSGNIVFSPGPATHLVYTTVPSTGIAGTAFSVTVTSEDTFGNPSKPTGNTTITLSKATGGGTLSGTLTGTIPTTGSSVTINTPVYSKADTMTLTATATVGETSLTAVTSGNIVFSPGAVSAGLSTVVAAPTSVAADGATTSTITVTLTDANGNPVSGKTVTLAQTGAATISPASGPSSASGVVTFTVTSTTAGGDTFTAKDVTDSNLVLTHTPTVTFVAGPATQLSFITAPQNTALGVASGTITIQRQDQFGNATISGGAISLALNTTSGTGSFTPASPLTIGVGSSSANFTYTDTTVGTPTISASSSGLTGDSQQETIFSIPDTFTAKANGNWNAASTWTKNSGTGVQTFPIAGDSANIPSFNVTVTANQAAATVNFTDSSTSGTLTVIAGDTLAVSGGITLSNNAGNNSTAASITGAGFVTCASINVGGTTGLGLFSSTRTSVLTSTISTLSVLGNINIAGTVAFIIDANNSTFALNSGSVSVGGSVALSATPGAIPGFSPSSTATLDMTGGSANGTLILSGSTPVTKSVSGAATVSFLANGANDTVIYSGASQPVFLTTYNDLTLSGTGTASLGGSTTIGGALTINSGQLNLGGFSSTATQLFFGSVQKNSGAWGGLGVSGIPAATQSGNFLSKTLNVGQGPATQLVFTTPLANTAVGATIANVVVKEEDASGNTITTDSSSTVTVAIGSNPVGGTLSGTKNVMLTAGVATFSTLSINALGNGYTLTATLTGLPVATSTPFNIVQATPIFSGLSSHTIPYGTSSQTLSGTLSADGGTLFPANGETISITINGSTQPATIGASGFFSVAFPTATIPVTGSPWTITYSYVGDVNLSSATDTSTKLTVTKTTPTISGVTTSQSISYGTTSVLLTGTVSAAGPGYPASGETVSVTINGSTQPATIGANGAFSVAFPTATIPVPGSPWTITYAYAGDGNLNAAANNTGTALTVNKALVTVTATAESKTYGQTVTFTSGSTLFSASGLQNGQTIASVTLLCAGGVATATVAGSPYTITPSAATGGTFIAADYTITYSTAGTLTVIPAGLTVTAKPQSKVYGTVPLLGTTLFTTSGLLNSDGVTAVTLTSPGGSVANAPVSGSPYAIIPSAATGSGLGNYTISYVNGNLTVNVLAVWLTGTRAYDGGAIALSTILSVANIVAGDDVSVSGSATLAGAATGTEPITDVSGLTLIGTTAPNYTLVGFTGFVIITPNGPPVAKPATYTRPKGTEFLISVSDLLTNTSDSSGDTVTLVAVNDDPLVDGSFLPDLTPQGSQIFYTSSYQGSPHLLIMPVNDISDTFSYEVQDASFPTFTAISTITINAASATGQATGSISVSPGGSVTTTWAGIPGRTYVVQVASNITGPWTDVADPLATIMAPSGGVFSYTDNNPPTPMAFYQLRQN